VTIVKVKVHALGAPWTPYPNQVIVIASQQGAWHNGRLQCQVLLVQSSNRVGRMDELVLEIPGLLICSMLAWICANTTRPCTRRTHTRRCNIHVLL
jgi:hypothetical protein